MIKKNYLSDLYKLAVTTLFFSVSSSSNTTIVPVNVGVILDDFNSGSGKMFSNSIRMAVSDFYASHAYYKTRLILKTRDSKRSVVGAAAAALDLIQNEQVQFILGPTTSTQTSFVINLGEQAQVPIISFSATSPTLGGSYFFQMAQNDTSQVKALTAIVQAFGWKEVVPIFIDTLHGRGVLPFLADALQEIGTGIPYLSVIPSSATDDQIEKELYKLRMMQTRVFIVHVTIDLSSRLFTKANEIGMMSEGYVWLTTSRITNRLTSMNSSVIDSMNGVIGVQTYVPETRELEDLRLRWNKKFQNDYSDIIGAELDVFGLWAYDAAFSIAMATEQVIGTASSFGFQTPNASNKSTDILGSFPVSPYGLRLGKALSTTRFQGIAGEFILIDGQLQSSNFTIINVNGRGARKIGYWTPQQGLVSKMSSPNSTRHLGPIVWPGDSRSVPQGWEIPTTGKKLRIGVPVKSAFTEFVEVKINTTTDVTGFSIDVFKAVVEMLPYGLPYEFIPFAKPDGTEAGSYDDLLYQVFVGKYDAVVGDITIRANRTLYIDFTLPYTESGVSMIVPIKDNNDLFVLSLKPLTWELWVTTGCWFIFIAFVVWVLEHRIKEDFPAGPPLYQIGTSFWFSFSTMVFAERERLVSNWARLVVIIWWFVVLILTQRYTASLASLLTVQQLQPTVNDVNLLLKNGENVGYQSGSFVYGILKNLGFRDEKLRTFDNADQLNELFRNGTDNNGIAAAFDETPYMKLFLSTYCSKYTMVEPTFTADGFAFVFPKGSPLAPDVSRAILNVNEGGEMQRIEDRWFKRHDSCRDTSNNIVSSTNNLSLESFWGLFLIAGAASLLALLIFLACTFLYEHKDIRLDSDSSVWRKVLLMLRIYDQKDLSSHTFRKRRGLEFHPNLPQSPSSYSNNSTTLKINGSRKTAFVETSLTQEFLAAGR